jgi:hypothetical protein
MMEVLTFSWTAFGSDPQPDARRWLHAFLCGGTSCNDDAYLPLDRFRPNFAQTSEPPNTVRPTYPPDDETA